MGLAFDDWDLDYYTNMFTADIKRDPTTVELFDIAQSNSEHSRHWFFGGELIKEDGTPYPKTLFQLVKDTYEANPNNSVVAFKDNSSTIRGFTTRALPPVKPGGPSPVDVRSIASRRVAVSRVGRRRAFHAQIASHVIISPGAARGPRIPSVRMNTITHTKDPQNSSNVHEHAVYRQLSSATAAWMTSGGRPRSHTGGDSIVSPDSRIDTTLYGTIRDSCVPPSPGIEINGGV